MIIFKHLQRWLSNENWNYISSQEFNNWIKHFLCKTIELAGGFCGFQGFACRCSRHCQFAWDSIFSQQASSPHSPSWREPRRVEEKFGEQNFRVFSEMRGINLYIDPKNWKFWIEIGWKSRNRLTGQNLKFWFLNNFDLRKMKNLHLKTSNSISILNFGDRNSKSIPKIEKSAPQNLKFDFDFEFLGRKFDFENFKIDFSIINSFRISIWDLKIWNQRCRKPLNLYFRFKILIFASNFSSTKILILY